MKTWKWVLIFLGVFVLAFCVALPIFAMMFGRVMMGGGIRDGFRPMMGGGFGMLRLFGGAIIGLGVLALAVIGLVALVHNGRMHGHMHDPMQAHAAAAMATPCPHCGAMLQPGWLACPVCGEKVEKPPEVPPEEIKPQ